MRNFILFSFAALALSACNSSVENTSCAETEFCENVRVVQDDKMGVVTATLADNKIQVLFDGASDVVTVDKNDLERQVSCFQGLCAGDRVLDETNNITGQVKTIFSKGTLQIKNDELGFTGISKASSYAKRYRCFDDFCVDRINADKMAKATISDIYSNGTVRIVYQTGQTEIRTMESLQVKNECLQGKKACEYKN